MEPTASKTPPIRPPATGAKPRRRLRNYLLEPRFQLRYAGLLAGVTLLVFGALGAVILRSGHVAAEISNGAVDLANVAANQAERALQESRTSAQLLQLQRLTDNGGDPAVARQMGAQLALHEASGQQALRAVQRQREQARLQRLEIERIRLRTVWLVVGAGLALGLAIFAVGIVLSHRVVGPSYRLKQLFWKVSRGDLTITEKLRDGDELVDLFEAFTSMVAALRAQQANDLTSLDGAYRALAKAHPDEAGVKDLREAIDVMRKRRGPADETARFRPVDPAP